MSWAPTKKETNLINDAFEKEWVKATRANEKWGTSTDGKYKYLIGAVSPEDNKPEIPPNRIEELKSMLQFLGTDDLRPQKIGNLDSGDRTWIDPQTREYEYLMEEWANQGMPYVRQFSKENPSKKKHPSGEDRAYFTWAGKYGSDSRFPEQPDTVHVRPGNVNDLLAEFGHTDQWNAPQDTRDKMAEWSRTNWMAHGRNKRVYDEHAYDTEGYLEHDAHSMREPVFNDRYWDALLETEENRKDKEDTGLLGYIKRLFTY